MDPRYSPPSTSLNPNARTEMIPIIQPGFTTQSINAKDVGTDEPPAGRQYGAGSRIFGFALGSVVGTFVVATVAVVLFKAFLLIKGGLGL